MEAEYKEMLTAQLDWLKLKAGEHRRKLKEGSYKSPRAALLATTYIYGMAESARFVWDWVQGKPIVIPALQPPVPKKNRRGTTHRKRAR
jgi:hypothetical protein